MGDADQLTFASARSLSLAALTTAFNRGFEGYLIPMVQTPDSLLRMLRENDVREDESLVALAPGGAPVGVALLGRRGARAWVAGMGVAPEWRGQGQGAALLARLLDRARALGAQQVTLEVLENNTTASRLYERMGFHETRPLTIYTGETQRAPTAAWRAVAVSAAAATSAARPNADPITFPMMLPDSPKPRRVAVNRALGGFEALHTFTPSWQREQTTLAHMATRLTALGVFAPDGVSIQAYMLTSRQPHGYTIMDIGSAGATATARLRDALTLLRALLAKQSDAVLRAINAPPDDPLGAALDALGCPVVARQREMALAL